MTRKAGLLSRHRKLIAKLLKREAAHHRFYEKECADRDDSLSGLAIFSERALDADHGGTGSGV